MPGGAAEKTVSRRAAFCRRLLLLLLVTTMSIGQVGAGMRLEPQGERILQAAKDFMQLDRHREVISVLPASDGTIWVLGLDHTREGRSERIAKCLRSGMSHAGQDIPLARSGSDFDLSGAKPIGTTPDGRLVATLWTHSADGDGCRLARVDQNGSVAVSEDLHPYVPNYPFVDEAGVAHLVISPSGRYIQVDAAREGLPVIRSLDYHAPFDGMDSVPSYLRWGGQIGFYSEPRGRLIVARRNLSLDTMCIRLFRIDSKTLSLVDTGFVGLGDAQRTWSGPQLRQVTMVSAGKSGYWVYFPTAYSPPKPTVIAYLVRPDLSVVHPVATEQAEPRPLAAAPPGSAFTVLRQWSSPDFARSEGALTGKTALGLEVTALGSDGQLYVESLRDTDASRVGE